MFNYLYKMVNLYIYNVLLITAVQNCVAFTFCLYVCFLYGQKKTQCPCSTNVTGIFIMSNFALLLIV